MIFSGNTGTTGKRKSIAGGLAAIAMLLGLMSASFAAASLPGTAADRVYGQGAAGNDFAAKVFATGASNLNTPYGVAVASDGGLYVSESANNRVLYFPATNGIPDFTATRVYGQGAAGNDFTTSASGTTATSLNNPRGVALDADGSLYVVDAFNNRVLYYPATNGIPAFTATRVYGQGAAGNDFTTNASGTSATSLSTPNGVAVALDGGIYVADRSNGRVLYFAYDGDVTADRVYGQGAAGNSFGTSDTPNPPSATSMNYPYGVAVASDGGLYVADQSNARVLYFPATAGVPAFTATRVYGQGAAGNSFTTKTTPNPPSATSLNTPYGLALASDGSLYVADYNPTHRVLYYPATAGVPAFTPTRVYGQGATGDSFTTNASPNTPSATSMRGPYGIAVAPDGSFYVADSDNSRVLHYGFPATQVPFTTQPNGAVAGSAFTTQPVITVKDENGNPVTNYTGNVTVAIKSGTGATGAVLGGTTTVAAVNGVATFSDLTIDLAGTGYVLT
ncbi:NHL repeat-containing protein, partial [Candidatus Chlorohelix sp.]|uniref:NHL repeat-containing protein n=1 Tax=Candidatus Chlorohelix sp. TaxID=3139201 RepID=UPI003072FCAC